jgi:hypothetical protein
MYRTSIRCNFLLFQISATRLYHSGLPYGGPGQPHDLKSQAVVYWGLPWVSHTHYLKI